ncbi:amidohydrolase family protein [Amycolatopsis sp. FDAARGOS 1241]|uniref:amidohydrolase family protein n=1 Tax=Amycolatopsis sp. FDAARGOS 1241 TaxID=2778070 RepID=UPI001EF1CA08|nr:amidohydrolase family protein [Amycolatopsis sp. FDAARGOS 1241]
MDTLITAARVLARPSDPIDGGAVLVRDGVLAAVGHRGDVAAAAVDPVVRDFPDATVLPGLFNVHVHLSFDATREMLPAFLASDDASLARAAEDHLGQLLRSGVTTVRDLGGRTVLKPTGGPRVLASGPPLTVPDGHCHFFGGAVSSDAEIRTLVDANAAAGADVIKVMAGGGQITEGGAEMWESQFSQRQLEIVVAQAARHGLPVAAHAHGADAIAASAEAGVSTIEHCTFMSGPGRTDLRPAVARWMAAAGISACSTSSRNWRLMAERMGEEVARRVYGRLPWLEEHGVRLLSGTDAGLPGSTFDDRIRRREKPSHS